MTLNTINNTREFQHIINNGRIAIIDFGAHWSGCSPLADLSDTLKLLGVDFYSVNVDETDDVVFEADVRVVPTFMVYKDGRKVGYAEGVGAGNLHKLMGPHMAGMTGLGNMAKRASAPGGVIQVDYSGDDLTTRIRQRSDVEKRGIARGVSRQDAQRCTREARCDQQ